MTGDSFVVLPRLDPDIHAVAEHIGWIVLRAAEADAALTVLAGPEGSVLKAWSLTGEPLGKAVTNAGYPDSRSGTRPFTRFGTRSSTRSTTLRMQNLMCSVDGGPESA